MINEKELKRRIKNDLNGKNRKGAKRKYFTVEEIKRKQLEATRAYFKTKKGKETRLRAVKKYFGTKKGKEKLVNGIKRYFKTEKGKIARLMAVNRYQARKNDLPATLTDDEWQQILIDFNYRCSYCGSSGFLVQEHFIPVSKRGGYEKGNIIPTCGSCNNKKGGKHPIDFLSPIQYQKIVRYLSKKG